MNRPMRLLLIDDDEVDRQAVLRALRRSWINFDICQAETAASGLRIAAEQHFDAVLLDYQLPDQNGIEVLHSLRSGRLEGVAVIVLTGQEDDSLAMRCLEAGAQDFLLKDEVNGRRLSRAVLQAQQRFMVEDALERGREQLRQLVDHDSLTGLLNRRGFEDELAQIIARNRHSNKGFALALLEINNFKNINDTLGRDVGDELLQAVAQRLATVIRPSDILCRLGEDEFVVLLTDVKPAEQATRLADRIVALFDESFELGASLLSVTSSIGIAVLGADVAHAKDLLKSAGMAMYQARQDGPNKRRFYSAAMQESVLLQKAIRSDLCQAVESEEFRVYYQAQIKAADGSLAGIEALLRWQHPRSGILLPEAFMGAAEESGLVLNLGNWVLHQAGKQLREWHLQFSTQATKLILNVNLSAIQLNKSNLLADIQKVMSLYNLDGIHLGLDITHSAQIEDAHAVVSQLASVAGLGITLSLDGFGMGYSSFDHLKLFPVETLKIDKSFVAAIGGGDKREKLLVELIAFAKAMNLKVVAEGIETKEQADFCIGQGCDLLQGYYFAPPIPADQFASTFFAA